MKKIMILMLVCMMLIITTACAKDEWVEYDYSNPEAKFKAEQMIKIPDDDKFEDYFECRVWATKLRKQYPNGFDSNKSINREE